MKLTARCEHVGWSVFEDLLYRRRSRLFAFEAEELNECLGEMESAHFTVEIVSGFALAANALEQVGDNRFGLLALDAGPHQSVQEMTVVNPKLHIQRLDKRCRMEAMHHAGLIRNMSPAQIS